MYAMPAQVPLRLSIDAKLRKPAMYTTYPYMTIPVRGLKLFASPQGRQGKFSYIAHSYTVIIQSALHKRKWNRH